MSDFIEEPVDQLALLVERSAEAMTVLAVDLIGDLGRAALRLNMVSDPMATAFWGRSFNRIAALWPSSAWPGFSAK